jgi:hypothetical protein
VAISGMTAVLRRSGFLVVDSLWILPFVETHDSISMSTWGLIDLGCFFPLFLVLLWM